MFFDRLKKKTFYLMVLVRFFFKTLLQCCRASGFNFSSCLLTFLNNTVVQQYIQYLNDSTMLHFLKIRCFHTSILPKYFCFITRPNLHSSLLTLLTKKCFNASTLPCFNAQCYMQEIFSAF
jgi:hypothetical protein